MFLPPEIVEIIISFYLYRHPIASLLKKERLLFKRDWTYYLFFKKFCYRRSLYVSPYAQYLHLKKNGVKIDNIFDKDHVYERIRQNRISNGAI